MPLTQTPLLNHWALTDLTVDVPSSAPPGNASPQPARWRTPEFLFYALCFVLVVPWMPYIPWARLNTPDNPNYARFRPLLSPSYVPGLLVDDSDAQYRSFRSNIPALGGLAALYFLLRLAYTRSSASTTSPSRTNLIPFHLLSSCLLVFALHGASALKIYALLLIDYAACKTLPPDGPLLPIFTWLFCGVVLYSNEVYEGYTFTSLHTSLSPLDAWSGFYPRWHISFNITMLRIISFNLDYRWAHAPTAPVTPDPSAPPLTDKQRVTQPHPIPSYTLPTFLAYALYPPLYIAGPILTYNDYLHQLKHPAPSSTAPLSVRRYLTRFLSSLLCMELVLHTLPVVAIKDTRAWEGNTPLELALVGFWNLIVVWLKLLIPWRFFRLWALADGMDPPENMVRCMANNYSMLGFWRSWHRSYNLWIVRYIYIPVGGSHRALLAALLVFTFVALWHDLSFRLLTWGWLVVLFFLPEILARRLLPASQFGSRWWYRHASALGGALNVLLMMGANLVGFVLGVDGTKYMLAQLVGSWNGLGFLLFAIACLFIAVQVMFEYREEELRRGIFRRC